MQLIHLVAHSSEFENIMVREEEQQELANVVRKSCPLEVRGGPEDKYGKINILIQVYLSRGFLDGFSLIADSSYISASLGRIMRALFEICLRRGWVSMTALLLDYCKAVDRRVWPHQHPLRQFDSILSPDILHKLEDRDAGLERLYDMDEKEIGALIRHPNGGKLVVQCLQHFPRVILSANVSPITRTVLRVCSICIHQKSGTNFSLQETEIGSTTVKVFLLINNKLGGWVAFFNRLC
jgi:activating signal cointegrator complex subunit 3